MFDLAWLLFAFPAAGVLINLFFGHRLSKQMIGAIASGVVVGAFVVALGLFFSLLGLHGEERVVTVHLWDWITIGTLDVGAAMLIDPLSITLTLVVTGVGALIHIYATSYMEHDERFQRFFIYLNFLSLRC